MESYVTFETSKNCVSNSPIQINIFSVIYIVTGVYVNLFQSYLSDSYDTKILPQIEFLSKLALEMINCQYYNPCKIEDKIS